MYTPEEMAVLDKIARDLHGCAFNALDFEEQDALYCYAEEAGLFAEARKEATWKKSH